MTLSGPDLEGAGDGLTLIVTGVFAGTLLFGWLGDWEFQLIQLELQLLLNLLASILSFLLVLFCASLLSRLFAK